MENNISGSWQLPPAHGREGAFLIRELSVLEVSGDDAETFLHGQFTNHIKGIGDAFRLAAYCQPQGKILALMRVAKVKNKFFILLPTDLVPGFVKRLSMFILRSKVSIRIASEMFVAGLINPEMQLPETDKRVCQDDSVIGRVSDAWGLKRVMVISTLENLKRRFSPIDDASVWFESEIVAGIPWVFEKTKEAFIPQWINLDKIGGLVFDKGCYPGQEIISRVQHIGTNPRRMVRVESSESVSIEAGDDVFQDSAAVGNVVMSVHDDQRTLALVEMTKKSVESGFCQIKSADFKIISED
jgi:folate-binding protein YgfZ